MEQDFDTKHWETSCPKYDCRKDSCKCGLKKVVLPASLGGDSDDSPIAPKNGAYCNALVTYEDNGHTYIYSQEGVPTLVDVDAKNIDTFEEELRDEARTRANADNAINERIDNLSDNILYVFDTVADMKASTELISGNYVRTLGYRSKGDDGGSIYYVDSNGTANEMDTIAIGSSLKAHIVLDETINPMQYGAYGNGVTDDTAVVQYIVDNVAKQITFTKNHFVTGIVMHYLRDMQGIGRNSGLVGQSNTYILNISRLDDDPADYRNYFIDNINISQRGGGDALLMEKWNGRILDFTIRNCRISVPYTGATGAAIRLKNVALTHSIIYGNTLIGNGIYGEIGDANLIQKNMIFGEGTGIRIDMPNGCLNNVIKDNTITTFGKNAIYIDNTEQLLIENNQIEYGGNTDQSATFEGMLVLDGSQRRCKHVLILNNNFGGGTHLNTLINLLNTDDVIIDGNRLVAVNNQEIRISAGAVRTVIRDGNFGVSQQSNPRTDQERKYIVSDSGHGTVGTWRELYLQGGTTQKLKYKKDENGFIYFKDFFIGNLTEPELCTLPLYYRPQATCLLKGMSYSLGEEVNIKVKYDGTMTLEAMPSAQTSLNIIGTYPTWNFYY